MIDWLHPATFFLLGAPLLLALPRGWARSGVLLAIPLLAGLTLLLTPPGVYGTVSFFGLELIFGRVDRLSLVFATIFVIMAFIGFLYALHLPTPGSHIAALLYVGGALGVVLAGDLLTVFLFSEIMAFSSLFLIWTQRTPAALAAGFRYILVHIFAGVCLLGGVVLHLGQTGQLAFEPMALEGLAAALLLLGFLINAAVPPLHAWLADAYPEATVTGAVFLSAFTTKTAVYLLIRGFPGTELLVWLGAVMTIYGVIYAMLENDMRRLLAYHIISQVGYMVAGVGIGTPLALNGAAAHAFAHILYKGLLFMGAGAVIQMTGKRRLTELGGLYRTMPLTMLLYMIAGFSISGVPLFSGFVSKSMVIAAAAQDHRVAIWLMLTLASAGTFLSTTLKLPYYAFFATDAGLRAQEPPRNMLLAMGLAALLCLGIGVYPASLYTLLPYPVTFAPYTAAHLLETLQILGFTALGFLLLLPFLHPAPTISLDTDWLYRQAGRGLLWLARHPVATADARLSTAYATGLLKWSEKLAQWFWTVEERVIDGTVNGVAAVTYAAGLRLRQLQTGQLQHYALVMGIGLLVILGVYLLV